VNNTRITIKKYPNRRLYNTRESAYITLDDVSGLIKKGFRINVVDVTTQKDVTALVLTQIIMNKAKNDNALLPVSLLHLAIQYGESHLHDFFEKYLEKTIENYLSYRKQVDDQMNRYMEMGTDFSTLAGNTLKNMDPLGIFSQSQEEEADKKKD
jgi:polyhydroxyalkanoate synthesis repressor PhaR